MKRLLPIGTVVKLDVSSETKYMIFARMVKKNNEDASYYDYCACRAPYGYQNDKELKLFNHSDVQQLLFIGLQDEEELQYSIALAEEATKSRKV